MKRRAHRNLRRRLTRQLRAQIAKHGIGPVLDRMFGPGSWRYDERERLWIVPDIHDSGPGRAYYCVNADGDWFKARLDAEHTQ